MGNGGFIRGFCNSTVAENACRSTSTSPHIFTASCSTKHSENFITYIAHVNASHITASVLCNALKPTAYHNKLRSGFRAALQRLCIHYHRILLLNGARFWFSSYNKRRCHINQLYQRLRPFLGVIIHSPLYIYTHSIYRYKLLCSLCYPFWILTIIRILSWS